MGLHRCTGKDAISIARLSNCMRICKKRERATGEKTLLKAHCSQKHDLPVFYSENYVMALEVSDRLIDII